MTFAELMDLLLHDRGMPIVSLLRDYQVIVRRGTVSRYRRPKWDAKYAVCVREFPRGFYP